MTVPMPPATYPEPQQKKPRKSAWFAVIFVVLALFSSPLHPLALLLVLVAIVFAIRAIQDGGKALVIGVITIVVAAVLGFTTLASYGSSRSSGSSAGLSTAEQMSEETADKDDAADIPPDQARFVAIVDDYAEQADGVQNDLKLEKILDERDVALCEELIDQDAILWKGTIEKIGADDLKYQAYMTVRIAPNVTVGSWNNALSDLGDNTLIDRDGHLFDELSDYDVGDSVEFIARMVAGSGEACVTGKNRGSDYASNPDFLAEIEEIFVD